jgi:hypothetical protein
MQDKGVREHARKAYGGVKIYFNNFNLDTVCRLVVILTLQMLYSRRKKTPGCVSLRGSMDTLENTEVPCPSQASDYDSSVVYPVI